MMMKMKLLAVVLIFVAAGAAMATDVINVAIRGYNYNTPYIGNGAYNVGPDANIIVWIPYYGGWGVPVGSARSEALVPATVASLSAPFQNLSSVYAAQVWIGDNGQNHTYLYGPDSNLMDSGFVAKAGPEPNISIWGQGAYQGVYDIYVYGNVSGTFTLTQYGEPNTLSVAGGVAPGTFVRGGNYVIFPNVDVNSPNSPDLYLSYSNQLNALQFVSKKVPFAIEPNVLGLIQIPAGKWNVAGNRNTRTTELTHFGPSTFADGNVVTGVGYLDVYDFMDYDITVDDANQGQYSIFLTVNGDSINPVEIDLDGRSLGDVNYATTPSSWVYTTAVTANLYTGNHTVRWLMASNPAGGTHTGANIGQVNFARLGNTVINNCADVVNYGFALASDLGGNCYVGLDDLALFVDSWLMCNNPDPNGCF